MVRECPPWSTTFAASTARSPSTSGCSTTTSSARGLTAAEARLLWEIGPSGSELRVAARAAGPRLRLPDPSGARPHRRAAWSPSVPSPGRPTQSARAADQEGARGARAARRAFRRGRPGACWTPDRRAAARAGRGHAHGPAAARDGHGRDPARRPRAPGRTALPGGVLRRAERTLARRPSTRQSGPPPSRRRSVLLMGSSLVAYLRGTAMGCAAPSSTTRASRSATSSGCGCTRVRAVEESGAACWRSWSGLRPSAATRRTARDQRAAGRGDRPLPQCGLRRGGAVQRRAVRGPLVPQGTVSMHTE